MVVYNMPPKQARSRWKNAHKPILCAGRETIAALRPSNVPMRAPGPSSSPPIGHRQHGWPLKGAFVPSCVCRSPSTAGSKSGSSASGRLSLSGVLTRCTDSAKQTQSPSLPHSRHMLVLLIGWCFPITGLVLIFLALQCKPLASQGSYKEAGARG